MTTRTRKSREEFVNEMNTRIAARNIIMEFVENVYFPLMATKFNGKVYNARFINTLNEEAKKVNERMYVKKGYDYIEISLYLYNWNYNDYESIYLKCNTNAEGRIDYDSTINDNTGKAWLDNFKKYIEEYQKSIDNYDEYMKVFEKLASALDEYNKIPYTFRGHLDTTWMRIY